MKILSAIQTREADKQTILNEQVLSIDLMERAARTLYHWFHENVDPQTKIAVYCGKGNNGGDGLALSRMLLLTGWNVKTYIIEHREKGSEDFEENLERLKAIKSNIIHVNHLGDLEISDGIVVDALLGSGLNAPLRGMVGDIVQTLNDHENLKIAIDIPTGLFADDNSGNKLEAVFQAHFTLTFQYPKLSFLLPETGGYTGTFEVLDIGLDKEFLAACDSRFFYLDEEIPDLLKDRKKFSHKGNNGHALLLGGSKGKIGAITMASKACIKAGAGLVTAYVPECGLIPLQSNIPEVMVLTSEGENEIDVISLERDYDAIGVGPGLGTSAASKYALFNFLGKQHKPLVVDADALNLLAQFKAWDLLPEHSILTPHPGEFKRMVPHVDDNLHMHASDFAQENKVIVVLKGAHTAVCLPDGLIYFNSTGNAGMATAGSGDVLTGMITSMLAQGYSPKESALLGVYIHGLAGDLALMEETEESLTATDLIAHLSSAFSFIKA